jgi:hypothetical protein
LQKGRVVEEGTHEGLLSNHDGIYWALVNAQQLSMDEPLPEEEANGIQSSTPLALVQSEGFAKANDRKSTSRISQDHSSEVLVFSCMNSVANGNGKFNTFSHFKYTGGSDSLQMLEELMTQGALTPCQLRCSRQH